MTKVIERERAIQLRSQGRSYGDILKEVHVSKSTLSLWLRQHPLSDQQISKIKSSKAIKIERYIRVMRARRLKKLESYYEEEKLKWLPMSKRELFYAGLFLYWGEGNKASRHTISINNTDPSVVKFALYWMTKSLSFPKSKVRVFMHLYDDMDIREEVIFWSKTLALPLKQFSRPYIKKSTRVGVTQKGYNHGTCGVRVDHTPTKERIIMAIKAISENFDII
ncbi:hypothetical protein A2803_03180 [Candidatus Woesebacteria bacterium RIFCSPHIGHO2_01_FULL_44_21]|uniref:Homing endonuclease LAGLIDADG domain-containing protein n=1 Tax=Candidatus Woesebacteria bacterium RIFCSPHIGHO2_01_FULL_44_21 TaxID=1802503 RepID=A0A1F7Z039_9BACT|nr:MAG: hypothetical protein A2803_03180 [Candidatus Woesebacteria bacterium RIFCSPHIGHO2_01_FULL_44_21]OGM69162.1 MAG: hypothetical protein A2897_05065 [Candidatus Woesebacteria bacterium RIFCSPLOWO2_01_FULL_44_24b]